MSTQKSNEELVALVQSGVDVQANMLQLWQQNQGYITAIAKRFQGYEDKEDLMQLHITKKGKMWEIFNI